MASGLALDAASVRNSPGVEDKQRSWILRGWRAPSPTDAVVEAKAKLTNVEETIYPLMITFTNNRHLIYGRELVESIPVSRAASAVGDLQLANFGWGLIRLMSLWDRASLDRASIPTIAHLLSDDAVRLQFRIYNQADWIRLRASPEELKIRSGEFDRHWTITLNHIAQVERSRRLEGLRQFRDAYIAHNLKAPPSYRSPKYGQEIRLMRTNTRLIQKLSLLLTNTDLRLAVDWGRAEQAAADLWTNMHFTILDQSPEATAERAGRAREARRAKNKSRALSKPTETSQS